MVKNRSSMKEIVLYDAFWIKDANLMALPALCTYVALKVATTCAYSLLAKFSIYIASLCLYLNKNLQA